MDIPVMTTRGPAEDPVIKIDKEKNTNVPGLKYVMMSCIWSLSFEKPIWKMKLMF